MINEIVENYKTNNYGGNAAKDFSDNVYPII